MCDLDGRLVYPIGYLDPVIDALLNRAKADPAREARIGAALSRRPAPGEYLQHFRHRYTRDIPAGLAGTPPIPPSTTGFVGDQPRSVIAGIPDQSSHARAKEWTGWTLLAAMLALDAYDERIPIPSKRKVHPLDPASPQRAYRVGLILLIGGALSLITEAEG
jgi:hypothetical protein